MNHGHGSSLSERLALKEEAEHRKNERRARDERILAHALANPDISQVDIARAFNVHRSVVERALKKRGAS